MVRRSIVVLLVVVISLMAVSPALGARRVEVEVVLVVDTSDSMSDELRALCGGLEGVVDELARRGISVEAAVLGIAETSVCADRQVTRLIPSGGTRDDEDWGPAVADLARHYEWRTDTVRLIIPMSDEGPVAGDPLDGEDEQAIQVAIRAARANGVVVSPLLGSESSRELEPLARELAQQTDGRVFVSKDAAGDVADGLQDLIRAAAEQIREPKTILEAIPTPADVILDGQLISTNLVLAILMTVVVGAASAVLNDTLQANQARFGASSLGRLTRAGGNLTQAAQRVLAPGEWSRVSARGRRVLGVLQLGLSLILTSLLGLFLQPGLSPLTGEGLALWFGMLLALALMSLLYEGLEYRLALRGVGMPTLRLRPFALVATLTSVALSRVVGFLPGYLYDRVTVCDVASGEPETALPTGRRVRNVLIGLGVIGGVGLSLWILSYPASLLLDWVEGLGLPQTVADVLTGIARVMRAFFLLGFFLAWQTLLFELLPHPATGGGLVFRRSRLIWAVSAFVVLLVLLHTLVNPLGTVDELLESGGLVLLLLASVLYSALAVGVWLFFALRTGDELAPDWGEGQWTTVMAISLIAIWVLAACSGLVMFVVNLFS
jgi:cell division protein FtsL